MMTPVFLCLLFSFIPAALSEGLDDRDISLSVSEAIAKANEGTKIPLTHGDIVPNLRRNADPCVAIGCKWPKRKRKVRIPISISTSFSDDERAFIIATLVTFHKSTCIRFVWRREKHNDFISFFPGNGCWSFLGRLPGGQPISLDRNGCLHTDTVQHEVLHALGFHHEHVRSDRDDYVQIFSENIQEGVERNFEKMQTNNLGTPYDFNSVMHYSNFAFSKNGQPTIRARSNPNLLLGQATFLSENDIARVNNLYDC